MFKVCYAWSWPETDWGIVSFGDKSWEEDSSGLFSIDFLLLCLLLWFLFVFLSSFWLSVYSLCSTSADQYISSPPSTRRQTLTGFKTCRWHLQNKNIWFYYLSSCHWFIKKIYFQVTQSIRKVKIFKPLFLKDPWKNCVGDLYSKFKISFKNESFHFGTDPKSNECSPLLQCALNQLFIV